jgi:uncharacterized membrane protein
MLIIGNEVIDFTMVANNPLTIILESSPTAVNPTFVASLGGGSTLIPVAGNTLTVDKSEAVSIGVLNFFPYEFVRWQDDLGNNIGKTAAPQALTMAEYSAESEVTVTAVFASAGDRIDVVLTSVPPGAELKYKIEALKQQTYTGSFYMARSEKLAVEAPASYSGAAFLRWESADGIIGAAATVPGIEMPATGTDAEYTAFYGTESVGEKTYYIIATADEGSMISPNGTAVVPGGENKTFYFSANEGRHILSVTVDGTSLTQEQIDMGYYIFYDVRANHTIDVKSALGEKAITLRIQIVEGKGYAEYSINGSSFVKYTAEVEIPWSADVTVRAHAADGYRFEKWETPAVVTTPEKTFNDVESPLYLGLYFSEDNGGWAVLNLICAVLALIAGAIAFIAGRGHIKKGDEERISKTALILRVLALIIGIVSVMIFIITEDLKEQAVATDEWTLLMAILFFAAIIMAMVSFRFDESPEDEIKT